MDTFTVDKSFYDIGASDLKELWESDLEPTMQDVLFRGAVSDADLGGEWGGGGGGLLLGGSTRSNSGVDIPRSLLSGNVVLHDRLMTDAVLGTSIAQPPIKSEHSYSLASDGDSLPDSPISHNRVDDMEDECFPTISMHSTSDDPRCSNVSDSIMVDVVNIKDEPLSDPDSPSSSCPASPHAQNAHDYEIDLDPMLNVSSGVLKHNVMLSSRCNIFTTQHRVVMPKMNIKMEPGTSGFSLPPTPPSCTSSDDSEDNASSSQPANIRPQRTTARMLISPQAPTRQPIHTPLISNQPKGSTGQLLLTDEEKRTLLAEGYPVPTRLPLTKAEEKSLKKIRRKIKNKISAQESRRKKKEYMDQLERKVEVLVSENDDYRKKIESLEDSNASLMSQLAKLQAIIARTHPQTLSRHNK